jgi:hypothetical protein
MNSMAMCAVPKGVVPDIWACCNPCMAELAGGGFGLSVWVAKCVQIIILLGQW